MAFCCRRFPNWASQLAVLMVLSPASRRAIPTSTPTLDLARQALELYLIMHLLERSSLPSSSVLSFDNT